MFVLHTHYRCYVGIDHKLESRYLGIAAVEPAPPANGRPKPRRKAAASKEAVPGTAKKRPTKKDIP